MQENEMINEAEKMLLGYVLRKGTAGKAEVQSYVKIAPEAFVNPNHQAIWACIEDIKNVGINMVAQMMIERGNNQSEYLRGLVAVKVPDSYKALADKVVDAWNKRRMKDAFDQAASRVYTNGVPAEDIFRTVLRIFDSARPTTMRDDVHDTEEGRDILRSRIGGKGSGPMKVPVPMPWKGLYQYGGLCIAVPRGQVVFIGGNEGAGKTTLLETVADNAAEHGLNVLFYNPEWTTETFIARRIWRYGGPSKQRVFDHLYRQAAEASNSVPTTNSLSDEELVAYDQADEAIASMQTGTIIHISGPRTIEDIERELIKANARLSEKAKKNPGIVSDQIDLVIVDYMQALEMEEAGKRDDFQKQNRISTIIERICQTYQAAGFVTSQINKQDARAMAGGESNLGSFALNGVRAFVPKLVLNLIIDPADRRWLFVAKHNDGLRFKKIELVYNINRGTYEEVIDGGNNAITDDSSIGF
jgi:replicative DNA helicase